MALRSAKDGGKEEKLVGQEKQKAGRAAPPQSAPPGVLQPWSPAPDTPGPHLRRRCSATCPTRSPWPWPSSPCGGAPPAPAARPRRSPADHGRPEQLAGAGGAEARPHDPAAPARPRSGRKPTGRSVSALPGPPAGFGQLLPRQTRRAPGTSTWGLRHQRRAAPPVRPRHFQRGPARTGRAPTRIRWGPGEGPGQGPGALHLQQAQAHALGGARGCGHGAVCGVCPTVGLLLPPYSAPVLSVVTTSALSHPRTRINHLFRPTSRHRRAVTVNLPASAGLPRAAGGEIRATVSAYPGMCPAPLAHRHGRASHLIQQRLTEPRKHRIIELGKHL